MKERIIYFSSGIILVLVAIVLKLYFLQTNFLSGVTVGVLIGLGTSSIIRSFRKEKFTNQKQ